MHNFANLKKNRCVEINSNINTKKVDMSSKACIKDMNNEDKIKGKR